MPTARTRTLVYSAILSLAVLAPTELLLRHGFPRPGFWTLPAPSLHGLVIPHSTRGYAYSPGYVGRQSTPAGPITIRINSLGLRDDPVLPGEGPIILALGDSFTVGYGIEQREAWPARLQRTLKDRLPASGLSPRVVNAGVSGYSTRQIRLFAEELVPRLRPTHIVVGIYSSRFWRIDNPYVFFEGQAVLTNMIPHLRKVPDGFIFSPFERTFVRNVDFWLSDHFYLGAHLLRTPVYVRSAIGRLQGERGRPTNRERLRRRMRSLEAELEELSRFSTSHGVPLLVLLVNHQLEDGGFDALEAEYNAVVGEWCTGLGIAVADPLPLFLQRKESVLRLGGNHHWSPSAHGIAAEVVADVLTSGRYFLPR